MRKRISLWFSRASGFVMEIMRIRAGLLLFSPFTEDIVMNSRPRSNTSRAPQVASLRRLLQVLRKESIYIREDKPHHLS